MSKPTTSLELLALARAQYESDAALCRALGIVDTSVSVAKIRGKTSPVLAGRLAEFLGLDLEHWIAVAALEAAPRSRVTDHLRRVLHTIA